MHTGFCLILFLLSTLVAECASGFARPTEQNYPRDIQGFLVQPAELAVVGIEGGNVYYLQLSVNGYLEGRPFVLTLSKDIQPVDAWPSRLEASKPKSAPGLAFSTFRRGLESPVASLALSSNQIQMISAAIEKSRNWSEISNQQNLHVEAKELLQFTNDLVIGFTKLLNSTNFTLRIWVPASSVGNFSHLPGITIDREGVDRLAAIIATLPTRRRKYLDFDERDKREERERNEIREKEKARIDELLR